MGAVAGSWAGLHGPGEKTIEKTGQWGPGRYTGLRVRNRGPGQRAAGCPPRAPGPQRRQPAHRQGPEGSYFQLPGGAWGQTPFPGGLTQGAVRAPTPRKVPTSKDFWSVLEQAPFGDLFPKIWTTSLWEDPSHLGHLRAPGHRLTFGLRTAS